MKEALLTPPVVVANWKMHPTSLQDAEKIFSEIKRTAPHLKNTTTVICPPFLHLGVVAQSYGGSKILLGGQDVSQFRGVGSQTGEVSGEMLADSDVDVAIIGHSERRAMGEGNNQVLTKIKNALAADLQVILCIGEKERDDNGEYLSFIRKQITSIFSNIPSRLHESITIAYEPLWAIGGSSDSAVTPHVLHQTVLFIRKVLRQTISERKARKVLILYGGSVKRTNAEELFSDTEVDGFLVGSASRDADHFCDILRIVNKLSDDS